MDNDTRLALNRILGAPEFRELQETLDDSGVLEVLGIHRREIYHTKALAWLLNPQAGHGMGAAPLKSFLHLVWREIGEKLNAADGPFPDPMGVEDMPLDSAVSTAEYTIKNGRRLDVATFYADKSGKDRPVLVIEYKIDAGEQDKQTPDYANWAAGASGDIKPFLVYLAPGSPKPEDGRFRHLSFDAYREWLEELSWRSDTSRRMHDVLEALLEAVDAVLDPQPAEAAQLERRFENEITALAKYAQSAESEEFSAVLDRFAAPLKALGIERKGRRRYGGSEFIVKVTDLLEPEGREPLLSPEMWRRTRGDAQLCYYSRALFKRVTKAWPGGTEVLWLAIWIDRPWSARTEVRLGIGSSFPPDAKKKAERRITDEMRKHIVNTDWHGKEGTLTVARMPVTVPDVQGPESDTPERAEEALAASGERIKEFVQAAARATEAWLNEGKLEEVLKEAASRLPGPGER